MDESWIAEANAALDSEYAETLRVPVGIVDSLHLAPGTSPLIAPAPGTRHSEERISNTWADPTAFGDPFRKMIACEPVMARCCAPAPDSQTNPVNINDRPWLG